MFKRKMFKKSEDFYFWSAMIALVITIGAMFLASFFPYVETTLARKILETVIGLDGVLFGFSAVMIGLFLRNSHKLSEITLKRCLMLALSSFWSFILSILFAFIVLALGQQGTNIPLFTPIFLTLFGSLCSSIYLVMIFIEEIFPLEKEKKTN